MRFTGRNLHSYLQTSSLKNAMEQTKTTQGQLTRKEGRTNPFIQLFGKNAFRSWNYLCRELDDSGIFPSAGSPAENVKGPLCPWLPSESKAEAGSRVKAKTHFCVDAVNALNASRP